MVLRKDLIHRDETCKIIGLIFEVFNDIGYGHKEIFYQKAIINTFSKNRINFRQQLKAKVKYKGREVGYYIFNFLVFNKIVIKIKRKNYFSKKDIDQLYSYLKVKDLKLELLTYFTKEGVRYKRIVNLKLRGLVY